MSGTVRYAYKGTSTEDGISSHLSAILVANGYTATPHLVGTDTGGTEEWLSDDFDLAQAYFASRLIPTRSCSPTPEAARTTRKD